ncbi:SUMO-specific isopeptidase USPL1 [Osmerus eperlanus]|uniref:SUMO-specific isopeptidase USPL1 n=1 Tax=Osmerus eperlanus TaxID=29151 RepID=UPI002E150996
MVIFSKCQRTARNHRIYSDLPMSGEDTGLGSSAQALAGYLGKVQERSASLENCPWCAVKGMTCVLRSYRINFQESITLCTSPQCLFPLVSRPLEDVLACLVPPEPQTGAKRRTPWALEREDPVPCSKRLRSEEESEEEASLQNGNPISQPGPTDMEVADHHKDSDRLAPEEMDQEALQGDEETVAIPEKMAPSPERVGLDGRLLSPPKPAQDALARVQTIIILSEYESNSEVEFICSQKNSSGPPKALTSSITTPAAISTLEEESDSEMELICSQKNTSGPPKAAESSITTPAAVSTSENGLSEDCAEGQAAPVCRPCSVDLSQSRLDRSETLVEPARDPTQAAKTPRRSSENMEDKAEAVILKDDKPRYGGGLEGSEITKITPSVDTFIGSKELVLVSPRLFWRNTPNLAWLDSLLVAMVNCRALKEKRPETKSRCSVVWELCTIYDRCCALVTQCCQDGIIKVPASLLRRVTEELEALRMFVFNMLQPKLQQGKEDRLVFALPLLLKMDSWAEPNFLPVFDWKCLRCGKTLRVKKPLTTLKAVVSDWNPLKSTVKKRCSTCNRNRLQEKKLIMESVPPVVALHFEKGLPDTEVGKYSFDFDQYHYHVTTVIQYSKKHKHFVTWIRKPSDSWLEFDGRKHPDCVSHRDLTIPAEEVHIVFWERGEKRDKLHKSSRVDPPESEPAAPRLNRPLEAKDFLADESDDLSQDDAGIVAALTTCDAAGDRAAGGDASIGSATLLDTFEGLSHDDIVTLTLVEVSGDSMGRVPASPLAPENRRASSETSPEPASWVTPGELILPTVVSSACHLKRPSVETGQRVSPVSSTPSLKPSSARFPWQRQVDIGPPSVKPHLLSPSLAKPSAPDNNASTPVAQTKPPLSNSSSGYTHRSQPPRPSLKVTENEALPLKAAEMYGGFCARSTNNPYQTLFSTKGATQSAAAKVPFQRASPAPPKPAFKPMAVSMTSLPLRGVAENPKISKKHGSQTKLPSDLADTDSLRLKLLKKLKAKKKKLEKLNQVLGHQGNLGGKSTSKPDSTILESYAVSSSTSVYNSPTYDEFFADLLSPATTTSNLSPDSTGLVETVTNGQEGGGDMTNGGGAIGGENHEMAVTPQLCGSFAQQVGEVPMTTTNDNFLEEFISGTSLAQTEMETEALSALDLFF